jgi:uncharacterized membrane protein required for colicin V production
MNTVFTIGFLVVIGTATLGGLRRGLRRELLDIIGIISAFIGGILLAKPIASLLEHWGMVEELPYFLAFICGFIAVSLGFSIFKGPLMPKEVDAAERLSGGIVGLGKGIVMAGFLLYMVVGIWPASVETVTSNRAAKLVAPITSVIDVVVGVVEPLLPDDFTEQVQESFRFFRETRQRLGGALDTIGE